MFRKTACWCIPVLAVVLLATAWCLYAAEHPKGAEHPKEPAKAAEHPSEHPKAAKPTALSKEDLAKEIKAYVKKDAALKGGYFLVYDKGAKKPLVLTLAKVHKERLSTVGKDTYFACADFKTPEGEIYDLDIFMKGPGKGGRLKVTRVMVHKEAGKERYNWYEEGGIWKTKHVKGVKKGEEHPKGAEHPKEHSKGAEHHKEQPEGSAPKAGSGTK